MEAKQSAKCSICGEGDAIWRCLECMGCSESCTKCCRETHQHLPFHRVERWNTKKHWMPAWLWQTGLRVQLGHGGKECPMVGSLIQHVNQDDIQDLLEKLEHLGKEDFNTHGGWTKDLGKGKQRERGSDSEQNSGQNMDEEQEEDQEGMNNGEEEEDIDAVMEEEDRPFQEDLEFFQQSSQFTYGARPKAGSSRGASVIVVVHTNGIHHIPFHFCACAGRGDTKLERLLEAKLFPTTTQVHRTVFTFQALQEHNLDNLECQTSAYHFCKKLQRMTNEAFPMAVPVSYLFESND